MKITCLLENTTRRADMMCEHGLSLYIETDTHKILFDMGQTDLFAKNARTLGVDLTSVDLCVLSHGHYDHGGGLSTFLARNDSAPVYVHRDAFLPHFNGTEKYIGLDVSLASHPRLRFCDGETAIGGGLSLFSCNDLPHTKPLVAHGLTERVGDDFIEDDFRHEQYLLIAEHGRRILISGCSHKGICDIVSRFSPDVLIGGFHISKMDCGDALTAAADTLASYPTDYYTCHCTGKEQFAFMRRKMERLHYLACGDAVEI